MNPIKDENAVSPVIGTILLVAITVVLIAIIVAVIMGMSGGLTPKKEVGLTVTPYAASNVPGGYTEAKGFVNGVIVVFHGGKDFPDMKTAEIRVGNFGTYDGTTTSSFNNRSNHILGKQVPLEIGKPYRLRIAIDTKEDYVQNQINVSVPVFVIGKFADGTEQIIYSANLNIPTRVL